MQSLLFSSITFLYYFLPITLFLYYVVPQKAKNVILFLASFVFYFWGEPKYSILLLLSVGIGYLGGRCIEKQMQSDGLFLKRFQAKTGNKIVLAFFITVTLAFLIFFKYTDFLLGCFGYLTRKKFAVLNLALPIGISFYTFQILSYYIDVYRSQAKAEHNLIDFAAYVTMFPQLIAGPIVRFSSVQAELKDRTITMEKISDGVKKFVCGLCKKVLIADQLGVLVSFFEKANGLGILGYWVFAAAYMMQLYYDFSGYSDMAMGLGKMLGFTFPQNFRYPFLSKSISEFWRRWHITLGSWFRDYLYIPLGGSRVSFLRWCFHMFLVWLLSGLWHGAGFNFALWGIYFGIFLSAEKLLGTFFEKRNIHFNSVIKHLYVLIVILFSFVLFRTETMEEWKTAVFGMFGFYGVVSSKAVLYEIKSYALLLLTASVGATPIVLNCWKKICTLKIGWLLEYVFILGGMTIVTAYLLGSSVHPFLYFRF